MNGMQEASKYAEYVKPWFAPPAWVFGPVWSVLYLIIAVTFGFVFYQVATGQWPRSLALPFALNLAANLAFTPLQFGLESQLLAALDILVVLGTLIWAMVAVYAFAPWITYALIPYLLWVSFATLLQLSITYLNW